MNNELYHWKYIKREKVGDKWKYYYDTGANAKKNYEQAKQKLDAYNRQEKGAKVRGLTGAGHEHSSGHAFSRYINSHYSDDGPRKKLEKEYEDAKAEYYDSPLGKKEQRAENAKRSVEKVKNWAKDKLGYDEKQEMETAETNAKVKTNKANDIARENNKWMSDNPGNKNIADLAKWQNNYVRDLADEAEKAYRDAKKDFDKTPLGMLERAKDFIDSSEEANEYKSASTKRASALENYKVKEKAYLEIKSKVDSGEYFDKDRGNYSIIEPYEKEYQKAKREYASAQDQFTKARKEYEATPHYKLKEASDRIKSGRKKVSEWFKTHSI